MRDYSQELAEAHADLLRHQELYGELLAVEGKERQAEAARVKADEAEARVQDLEAQISALNAASAKAVRDEAERRERARKAELDRLLAGFHTTYDQYVEKARAADEAFDTWMTAMEDLEEIGRDLSDNYRPLNLNPHMLSAVRGGHYWSQLMNNTRNYGTRSIRAWWANSGKPYGSGKRLKIVDMIPTKAALFK